ATVAYEGTHDDRSACFGGHDTLMTASGTPCPLRVSRHEGFPVRHGRRRAGAAGRLALRRRRGSGILRRGSERPARRPGTGMASSASRPPRATGEPPKPGGSPALRLWGQLRRRRPHVLLFPVASMELYISAPSPYSAGSATRMRAVCLCVSLICVVVPARKASTLVVLLRTRPGSASGEA